MSRKPREDVRKKILDTAESLFAQKGFDSTGIDLIAKTAGITKSLIYYYFESKDEILSKLFQDFISESIEIKKYITDNTMADNSQFNIEKILKDHTLPFLLSHKDIIKIAFTESVKDAPVTPHLNIFQYFDQNFQANFKLADQYDIQYNKEFANLNGFFLFWAPLFSFVIFSDEWCDYYQCDLASVTALFVSEYAKMYKLLINPKSKNGHSLKKPVTTEKSNNDL
ncbi:MAG TPA: TetR/AcrR family transcriptional regulator [Candidatus Marinimicrobia bacterium]|nr:TetR/AcrR family transcriptional regulator [Candidatus Neomarinimicrobiota bacterium]